MVDDFERASQKSDYIPTIEHTTASERSTTLIEGLVVAGWFASSFSSEGSQMVQFLFLAIILCALLECKVNTMLNHMLLIIARSLQIIMLIFLLAASSPDLLLSEPALIAIILLPMCSLPKLASHI